MSADDAEVSPGDPGGSGTERHRLLAVVAALVLLCVAGALVLRVWIPWWPRDGGPPWDDEPPNLGAQLWVEQLSRTQALVVGSVTDDGHPDLPFSRWTTVIIEPTRVIWRAAVGQIPAWQTPIAVET